MRLEDEPFQAARDDACRVSRVVIGGEVGVVGGCLLLLPRVRGEVGAGLVGDSDEGVWVFSESGDGFVVVHDCELTAHHGVVKGASGGYVGAMSERSTVLVAFNVRLPQDEAEAYVADRLSSFGPLGVMLYNDGTDFDDGTDDKIDAYGTVKLTEALEM